MDKNDYKHKSEQIRRFYESKEYASVIEIAEQLDWKKVSATGILSIIADAYEKTGNYQEAFELLEVVYEESRLGRSLAYRLCLLALKLNLMDEAVNYYTDYIRKASRDPDQYILKYKILKAKNSRPEEQIKALEDYLSYEIDDKWQLELVKLYEDTGNKEKCIELSDQMATWFGESEYVIQALETKRNYEELTPEQDKIVYKKEEVEEEIQEEEIQEEIHELEISEPDFELEVEEDFQEITVSENEEEVQPELTEEEEEEYVQVALFEMEEPEEDFTEEEGFSCEELQMEGQLTIESLLEEKTRLIKEELEKENQLELDGPFGNIIGKEVAEQADQEKTFCLSPEMLQIFERYLPIKNMENQLETVLDNLINKNEEDGTSSSNNIIITGDEKSGKTSLIIDIIKVVNRERNKCGRKIAKIKGESLNRKGMAATMPKLVGSDLIIERAGNLNPETIQDLIQTMTSYTENMLVILEDSDAAIDRMFNANPLLKDIFNNIIEIKELGVKDWVEVAKEYARVKGYIVDEMGTLALHLKIGNIYSRDFQMESDDVEEIIDDAISKIKRRKRQLKKNRIDGFIVLKEADFL